jgi:hypothetical protein
VQNVSQCQFSHQNNPHEQEIALRGDWLTANRLRKGVASMEIK